jgi:hypothetical protein
LIFDTGTNSTMTTKGRKLKELTKKGTTADLLGNDDYDSEEDEDFDEEDSPRSS